ncbi:MULTISPECIES: SDR family oxidoreductase [Haloferacaceae]|uniref:SDR family oxidoreductase n=1 Tax=Halorubrum glutamatedens TaxID=2707018 RepID=A0ABD5QWS2_9EURY|nr:NAD(P)H-binding protein [Halobellus captivus]
MIRTLVTGATGALGVALRPRLIAVGHVVRGASRSPPTESEENLEWVELDLIEGTGMESAVKNVDVVIHAATAPQGDTDEVDVQGTKRLLEAAQEAGVENFLYPSIVGVDDVPLTYYEHKVAAETAVEDGGVPATIVRATQFHSFVAEMLGYVAKLPVWPLPTSMQFQPVDVREVADVIVDHATPVASGRIDPVGGPDVCSVGELARIYRTARGLRRPIIRVPIPGKTAAGFRDGHAICPDHRAGTVTWTEWLAERYTSSSDEMNARAQSTT